MLPGRSALDNRNAWRARPRHGRTVLQLFFVFLFRWKRGSVNYTICETHGQPDGRDRGYRLNPGYSGGVMALRTMNVSLKPVRTPALALKGLFRKLISSKPGFR